MIILMMMTEMMLTMTTMIKMMAITKTRVEMVIMMELLMLMMATIVYDVYGNLAKVSVEVCSVRLLQPSAQPKI